MAPSPALPPTTKLGSRVGLGRMPVGRSPRLLSWPFSSPSSPFTVSRPFATAFFATSTASAPAPLTAAMGSPPPAAQLQWSLDGRHLLALNVTACAVALSVSWLFFSAIPAILALGRASKSLEKVLDTTREELPDTMAALRLCGMEICDLTTELSELGEGIGRGIRSSTRAVRVAEDGLRRLTTMGLPAPVQLLRGTQDSKGSLAPANAVRNLREGIVRGRATLGAVLAITWFSRWAFNCFATWRKNRLP